MENLALSQTPPNTFLGVRVDPISRRDVVEWADRCISQRSIGNQIVVVNVAKLVEARRSPQLRHILDEADVVTADGAPIVWLSRFFGSKIRERVAGIDVMYDLLLQGDRLGWSFFFLGATQEVIEQYVARVKAEYPNLKVAGFHNGYFDSDQEDAIVRMIKEARPNVLFIAFGSPKKEIFVETWRKELEVNVIHGVGGSFDVFVGKTKRAPRFIQKAGLEWLYRLLQEPRRMFKRYAVTNTIFLGLVIRETLRTLPVIDNLTKHN